MKNLGFILSGTLFTINASTLFAISAVSDSSDREMLLIPALISLFLGIVFLRRGALGNEDPK